MADTPRTTRQLASTLSKDGTLKLELVERDLPDLGPAEVLIDVAASPINPSDMGLIFGPASGENMTKEGDALVEKVSPEIAAAVGARLGTPLYPGNEGCGTVIAAGDSEGAQALLGKFVTGMGGGFYADYRVLPTSNVIPLPDGTDPKDAASAFVNPLTALYMVETAKSEGHKAIINTAAASQLGRMLVKLCAKEGLPLISIVRKPEQVAELEAIGAKYALDSSADDFREKLVAAIDETDATMALDAIGGGKMGGQLLSAMEQVYAGRLDQYSVYGSSVMKQLYIYGRLEMGPVMLPPGAGFAWSASGWLLTNRIMQYGVEKMLEMRGRVAEELTGIFATSYSNEISLDDLLDPKVTANYAAKKTGEKYLVRM